MAAKIIAPGEKMAIALNLMPKTTGGKKWLKRIVFGEMVTMPAEIEEGMMLYSPATPLPLSKPDREHKVLYCVATLR